MTTTKYEKFVQEFVAEHVGGWHAEDRDDFRQNLFVALIEEKPTTTIQIEYIALRVLEECRKQRWADKEAGRVQLKLEDIGEEDPRARFLIDPRTPNLDSRLHVEMSLRKLPPQLRAVAEDLFYREMKQSDIAKKYGKEQPWVAKTKAKIKKLLSKSL